MWKDLIRRIFSNESLVERIIRTILLLIGGGAVANVGPELIAELPDTLGWLAMGASGLFHAGDKNQ